jgi:hypothetical protein
MSVSAVIAQLFRNAHSRNSTALPELGKTEEYPGDRKGHPCDAVDALNRANRKLPWSDGYLKCIRGAGGTFTVSGGSSMTGASLRIQRGAVTPLGKTVDVVTVTDPSCAAKDERVFVVDTTPAPEIPGKRTALEIFRDLERDF